MDKVLAIRKRINYRGDLMNLIPAIRSIKIPKIIHLELYVCIEIDKVASAQLIVYILGKRILSKNGINYICYDNRKLKVLKYLPKGSEILLSYTPDPICKGMGRKQ